MSRPLKDIKDLQKNLVKVYLTDEQLDILEAIQYKLNVSKSSVFIQSLSYLNTSLNKE